MAFQIKNKDGEAVTMKQLDAEAAALWGKEVHEKYYAEPPADGVQINWFDSIGWNIHDNKANRYKIFDGKGIVSWTMVQESLILSAIDVLKDPDERLGIIRGVWKHHLDLIKHWESKGYTPHKVEG